MNLTRIALGLVVVLGATNPLTHARREAPVSPSPGSAPAIDPSVEITFGYSNSLQRTRLEFIVRNGKRARLGIERFGVSQVRRPLAVHSPPQWAAMYGFPRMDSVVVWSNVDTLTPDVRPLVASPSPYGIMPGDSALIFTMFVRDVPSRVTCWAKRFHTIPELGSAEPDTWEWDWESEINLDSATVSWRSLKKEPKVSR